MRRIGYGLLLLSAVFPCPLTMHATAALCPASRIYENKHRTSDVFFGAVIGYSVGRWPTHKHKRTEVPGKKGIALFQPYFSDNAAGLSLAIPLGAW